MRRLPPASLLLRLGGRPQGAAIPVHARARPSSRAPAARSVGRVPRSLPLARRDRGDDVPVQAPDAHGGLTSPGPCGGRLHDLPARPRPEHPSGRGVQGRLLKAVAADPRLPGAEGAVRRRYLTDAGLNPGERAPARSTHRGTEKPATARVYPPLFADPSTFGYSPRPAGPALTRPVGGPQPRHQLAPPGGAQTFSTGRPGASPCRGRGRPRAARAGGSPPRAA